MCGIAGFLLAAPTSQRPADVIHRMTAVLEHRGPDDDGVWLDMGTGVALGHRRLSILDLSPAGHQPMVSAGGRYVAAFNGEIYNFLDLRRELQRRGCQFVGHSDTEVLLTAVEEWGLRPAVERFNGMFACAVWDRRLRRLHLFRDRLGEKPLYYGLVAGSLLFASELKALREFPAFPAEIDRDALALFLRLSYIPAPFTIYRGILKLPPGTLVTIDAKRPSLPAPEAYWSAAVKFDQARRNPYAGSDAEAREELTALLGDAVRLRMHADVPLGAFLSGGVDSSTVVALMQAQSDRPVRTFTIGFHEAQFDEAKRARRVAAVLGTDHTELFVTPEEARAVIPRLPAIFDEPFADPSQIPTFLVAELARRHVVVSMSGDGGDELFGGYNRYHWGRSLRGLAGVMPRSARVLLARSIRGVSPVLLEAFFERAGPLLPRSLRLRNPAERLPKVAAAIAADGPESWHHTLVSTWDDPASVVLGSREPPTRLSDRRPPHPPTSSAEWMMFVDTVTYLPDDILVKVDRASMAVSLEARVPLLDHRLVEFAFRLPLRMKVRQGRSKWLLRQVLNDLVPADSTEQAKMGFEIPIASWLRGPLRDWAEALLTESRLRAESFFDPGPIRRKWAEHVAGQRNWYSHLWNVLMAQAWLEEQRRAVRL